MGLSRSSYRFRDKGQLFAKFFHPVHLMPSLSGFPLEFCNGGRANKTRIMPLPDGQYRAKTVVIFFADKKSKRTATPPLPLPGITRCTTKNS